MCALEAARKTQVLHRSARARLSSELEEFLSHPASSLTPYTHTDVALATSLLSLAEKALGGG